jgi:uncharacterized membrane protein
MYKSVAEYLSELRRELAGCDPATIQDALADAEEHFYSAAGWKSADSSGRDGQQGISSLLETFGTPQEVAAAYREIETRLPVPMVSFQHKEPKSILGKFFGIAADFRTWGALLYMLFALVTGIIYGMWGLVAGALSLFFLIFIIGIPMMGLYLLSVRGLALMEGRIVETLLGVRMPRKPVFVRKGLSLSQKFKALVLDSTTWKALFYLVLRFPLGLLYSTATFILLSFSIKFMLYPLWFTWLNRPLLTFKEAYFPPEGLIPLISLAGVLAFFLTLHLARWVGKQHGRLAKYMLVRK